MKRGYRNRDADGVYQSYNHEDVEVRLAAIFVERSYRYFCSGQIVGAVACLRNAHDLIKDVFVNDRGDVCLNNPED